MGQDGTRKITGTGPRDTQRGINRMDRLSDALWGVRTPQEVLERGLEFLAESFSPKDCIAAVVEGDKIRITGWVDPDKEKAERPLGAQEELLLKRWAKEISKVWTEQNISIREGEQVCDVFFPLLSSQGLKAVVCMAGCPKESCAPRDKEDINRISRELGERIAILQETKGDGEDRDKDKGKNDETREKFLESLLIQITKEALKRQEELEELKKQWAYTKNFTESVLQSLSSGLISVDNDGRITYMNRGAEKILQYSVEEVLGKPLSFVMTSKDKIHPLHKNKEVESTSFGRQIRIMRKDGTEIPIGFTVSSHTDMSGKEIGKIIHFRDLTEINEMQEEILRMDRLVFLGEISMGIAHEIRNPLAGIRITAQALEEEVAENELLKEYVSRIISEIDRLNELLKSFLSFAKPQKPQLMPCFIPDLIDEVLFLLRKDLERRKIKVVQDHAKDIPNILVDSHQMKQVFFNLILNSMQAISGKGVISISSKVMSHKGPQKEVVVAFSDTGKGILPQHQSKIFDPFFTTKAKGVGLGLSITYRIVKRHGGRIRVKSEVGKGTTFFIHLPIEKAPGTDLKDAVSSFDRG
jgi:PAS domain S-box-containing protein